MAVKYLQFYKNVGVRTPEDIKSPGIVSLSTMPFPNYTVLHDLCLNGELGLGQSDAIVKNNLNRKVYIKHITSMTNHAGSLPPKLSLAKETVKSYRRANPKIISLKNDASMSSRRNQITIINYSALSRVYSYNTTSPKIKIQKWRNRLLALVEQLRVMTNKYDVNNFVIIGIPHTVPNYTAMQTYSRYTDSQLAKVFSTPEEFIIFELFKEIDGKNSVFSGLGDELHEITIIFSKDGKGSPINLGYLLGSVEEDAEKFSALKLVNMRNGITAFKKMDHSKMSRLFVQMLKVIGSNAEIPSASAGLTDDKKRADIDEMSEAFTVEDTIEEVDSLNEPSGNSEDIIHEVIETHVSEATEINNALLKKSLEVESDKGMTAKEYKRLEKRIEKARGVVSPLTGKSVGDKLEVTEEESAINFDMPIMGDTPLIIDKTMLNSSVSEIDKKYIDGVMDKHIANSLSSIQRAGVIVEGHTVEEVKNITGGYNAHTIKLAPLKGKPSTLHFRLPIVDSDGTFTTNGIRYRMRRQKVDLPIRKIDSHKVGLSSYVGKLFVYRSDLSVDDKFARIAKKLTEMSLSEGSDVVINPTPVFDNKVIAPRAYTSMAKYFMTVRKDDYRLYFDYLDRVNNLGVDSRTLKVLEKEGSVVVGKKRQKFVIVDSNNIFHIVTEEGESDEIGSIEDLLGLTNVKLPVDLAVIKIMGKAIPLGIVLGYYLGIDKLIQTLKVKATAYRSNKRVKVNEGEMLIKFLDVKLILSKLTDESRMIFQGFVKFEKVIKQYKYGLFKTKDVYLNVIEERGLKLAHLKELDLLKDMFIDPMTEDALRRMKEPTALIPLLMRAAELLIDDYHPASTESVRLRGYERFPGALYKEMYISLRKFSNRPDGFRKKLEMSPYDVWSRVMKDQSIKITEDTNPIVSLKEAEAVTFVGEGGRSKETMNQASRAYVESDLGIISEGTVDSGDVGINTFMSANPRVTDIFGMSSPMTEDTFDVTSLLSTSALLAPGVAHEDPKRTGFISIQNAHVIATEGSETPHVRTGYELVMPYRVGKDYAFIAEEDGVVDTVSKKGISVTYKSGKKDGVKLGIRYGRSEGTYYPHEMVKNIEEGKKFKKGQSLAYNTGFFAPDDLDPSHLCYKHAAPALIGLEETAQTFEDSSLITSSFSKKLKTTTAKERSFIIDYTQHIHKLVNTGDSITPNTPLFYLEDAVVGSDEVFTEDDLEILSSLSAFSPKSKVTATVGRIEVRYHGDKSDMSQSLRRVANRSDKELRDEANASNSQVLTGAVDSEYRIKGKPLSVNKLELKIYLLVEDVSSTADKAVFANQLKSTHGEVLDGSITTEDGRVLDGTFSERAIGARIVDSTHRVGLATAVLKALPAYLQNL